jgi:hypothetical protein
VSVTVAAGTFVFVAGAEEFFGGDDFASARRFPVRPHGEHTITLR